MPKPALPMQERRGRPWCPTRDPRCRAAISEPQAKALLSGAGVRVTREMRVTSAAEAIAAADKIGYPVVLKGVSSKIVHKTDAGIVKLGLADAAAVAAAFNDVNAKLRAADPQAEGCVVAESVRGELELIVGAKLDQQFGPSVLVGAGGVLVERSATSRWRSARCRLKRRARCCAACACGRSWKAIADAPPSMWRP